MSPSQNCQRFMFIDFTTLIGNCLILENGVEYQQRKAVFPGKERDMRSRNSIQSIRSSYRRRQRMAPFIVGGIIILVLIIIGIVVAIALLSSGEGGGMPSIPFLSSKTPTPSETPIPSDTPTITLTPTVTMTETPASTITPIPSETPSGPFTYKVQEGDVLFQIAEKFGLDLNYLIEYNKLTDTNIFAGQEIIIPLGVEPPTATDIPTYLPKGRVIEIVVKPNDSWNGLASTYNSTIEGMLKENEDVFGKIDIKNDSLPSLEIGQHIKIPANLVTRTPTITPQISVRQTQTQAAIQTVMSQPTQ